MISVVVVSYNEADKLDNCLKSISGFGDEIVVIDLQSTDHSKVVAKKYHAKIFSHQPVAYVELVRNFAVSKAKGDWILMLDPDEQITSTLASKLEVESLHNQYAAIDIPRKNIFFGKWISHTNWWPDRHVRFFNKKAVEWLDKIHKYPKVNGKVLALQAREDLAIIHFGYSSISEFINRQNRYSSIEAKNQLEAGKKFNWTSFLWMPLREFLVRFIKHQGYLDGFYGLSLTALMMLYQMSVQVKMWEQANKK